MIAATGWLAHTTRAALTPACAIADSNASELLVSEAAAAFAGFIL